MVDVIKDETIFEVLDDCVLEHKEITTRFEPYEILKALDNLKFQIETTKKNLKTMNEHLKKLKLIKKDVEHLENERKEKQDKFLKGEIESGEV